MHSNNLIARLTLGANLGVFIALVLVLAELNQIRDLMKSQVRHDLSTDIIAIQLAAAGSEGLADIIRRASKGEELTPTETIRFRLRLNALLRYWEELHSQYRLGHYDEAQFLNQREIWSSYLREVHGLAEYWCETSTRFTAEFQREIGTLLPDDAC